jgi:hypothetical protein
MTTAEHFWRLLSSETHFAFLSLHISFTEAPNNRLLQFRLCEYCNEPSDFIKIREFVDQLSDCQLLEKYLTPFS